MSVFATALIALVALIHVYIAVFEMFLWERRGPRVFTSFDRDLFGRTTELAFNQGVYNAVLAVGLGWSLFISDGHWQRQVATFFLAAVAVAGGAGATVERKILLVQTVPALLALVVLWLT